MKKRLSVKKIEQIEEITSKARINLDVWEKDLSEKPAKYIEEIKETLKSIFKELRILNPKLSFQFVQGKSCHIFMIINDVPFNSVFQAR